MNFNCAIIWWIKETQQTQALTLPKSEKLGKWIVSKFYFEYQTNVDSISVSMFA